jgi:uncharacterized protein with PIN domain
MESRKSFLFDRMLGRLCRRMRLLGFDSKMNPESEEGRFLVRADSENRLAVTISRRKTDRPGTPPLILESRGLNDQIAELLGSIEPPPELKPFTRCLECNHLLEDLSAFEAEGAVPKNVIKNFDDYKRCPGCDRIYWKGSHYEAMMRTVEKITKGLETG